MWGLYLGSFLIKGLLQQAYLPKETAMLSTPESESAYLSSTRGHKDHIQGPHMLVLRTNTRGIPEMLVYRILIFL